MSGTNPYPTPSQTHAIPPEGSKYVVFSIRGDFVSPFLIPLLRTFQSGQFTTVQTVMIDNTTNGYTLSVTSLESGQTIVCPPFTMRCAPILCGPSPEFSVQTPGSNFLFGRLAGTIRLYFINVSIPAYDFIPDQSLYYVTVNPASGALINVGAGLRLFTPPAGYRAKIKSIELSLAPQGTVMSAANTYVALYEQASSAVPPGSDVNYNALWSALLTVPMSAAGNQFYERQVSFGDGLVQAFNNNPVYLYSGFLGGFSALYTIAYSLVQVN